MIRIRTMTLEDLPLGLQLSGQAGWNQTPADWRRLLELQPDGVFVAERAGAPVGTVTTCRFGSVAWVAMVLVDEEARGRGIGRALVDHALGALEQHGVLTVLLDATPLGQPLYETLGFVAEYPMARYQGQLAPSGAVATAQPMGPGQMDDLIALDRAVTGTDRGRLLRLLAAEEPQAVRVAGRGHRVDGFLMARPGRRAWQIGPCIAGAEAGSALLIEARHTYAGQNVFLDVPADHAAATALAQSGGLTVQRLFMRMRRGEALDEDPARLWAGSGPEKG